MSHASAICAPVAGEVRRLGELGPLPAEFSLAVAERWNEVEDAIERWRALGVAATREEVVDAHREALRAASPSEG